MTRNRAYYWLKSSNAKIFSILISLVLLFTSLFPYVLTTQQVLASQENQSNQVTSQLSFNETNSSFNVSANTLKKVTYLIAYNRTTGEVGGNIEAIKGSSEDGDEFFKRQIQAATCSSDETCVAHEFNKVLLKIKTDDSEWPKAYKYVYRDGFLVLVGSSDSDNVEDLLDGEREWLESSADLNVPALEDVASTPAAIVNGSQSSAPILFTAEATEHEESLETQEMIAVVVQPQALSFSTATLSTDKADYAPDGLAIISGSGLEAAVSYKIVVTSEAAPTVTHIDSVATDVNGDFIYLYQLDGNYRPNYKVELKDTFGVVVSSTTFTDSRTLNSVTINGGTSVTASAGQSVTVALSVTNAGSTPNKWFSTSYQVGALPAVCVNTADHTTLGTFTETFNITAPAVGGSYNLVVYAHGTDNTCAAGTGGTPVTLTNGIIVDTTAPSVPTHVSPSDNSFFTTAGLTHIDWSDEVDALSSPVSYTYQSSTSSGTNPDGSFVSPAYTSGPLAVSQISTAGTPEGVYYWHVRASDSLGNASAWSSAWKVTIDNTAPTGLGVPSTTTPTGSTTQTWSWTAAIDTLSGIAQYAWRVVGGSSGTVLGATTTQATNLLDGVWDFFVKAIDNAGNESSETTGSVLVDTTAPDAPLITSSSHTLSAWNSDRTIDISWSASDPSGINGYSYLWNLNPTSIPDTTSEGVGTSNTSTNRPTSQSVYFHIRTVDGLGHWSSTTHYGPFWIDATNPTNSWSNPIDSNFLSGTVNLEVNAGDVGSGLNFVRFRYMPSGGAFVTIFQDVTSPYSTSWDTTGLGEGAYVLRARAEDNSGRANTKDINVSIDNTSPTEPVASPIAGSYITDQSVTLSSTDALSGLDKIYYTTDGTAPDNTSTEYTGAITVDQDMTIKAISYDLAGNTSSVLSATYEIAPTILTEGLLPADPNAAIIFWTTDTASTSRVVYDKVQHPVLGSAPNYGYALSTVEQDASPKVTYHQVIINGLENDTVYYYRVISHGSPEQVGAERNFKTNTPAPTTASSAAAGTPATGGSSTVPSSNTGTVLAASTVANEEEVLGTTDEVTTQSAELEGKVKGESTDVDYLNMNFGNKSFLKLPYFYGLLGLILMIIFFIIGKKKKKKKKN